MKYFSTPSRVAVFALLFLIITIQALYYFVDFSDDTLYFNSNSEEVLAFQKEIDSLKLLEIENRNPKIYPFNPSFITDYKGYKLGMSTVEIDKLLAFRKAGNYINSAKQFQKVTGISDSLLAVLSPNFKFPDWVINKQNNKKNKYKNTTTNNKFYTKKKPLPDEKIDLNLATSEELQRINGVGVKLAARILKYKDVLKGYSYDDQLYEVWYLDKEVADKVMQHFTVLTKPTINKININTASFKQVLHLPYIDYNLTKKIFNFRDEMAEIQSLEELKKIDSFPIEKFNRISLYLKAE